MTGSRNQERMCGHPNLILSHRPELPLRLNSSWLRYTILLMAPRVEIIAGYRIGF